jgi:fibronectin-binding autotransporter adhesin
MSRCARLAFFSVEVFVATLAGSTIHGATDYWQVSTGDWSVASNWGGTLPDSSSIAIVTNNGTANITLLGATCGTLSLGSGAGSGSVLLSAGSLGSDVNSVGASGTGIFTQTGGTNSASNLFLGYDVGSSGNYSFGGGLLSSGGLYVGYSGSGSFTQSGGTNSSGSLYLGYLSDSIGTYDLRGGQLAARDEHLDGAGNAVFNQTGGVNNIAHALFLGSVGGVSDVEYNLVGGVLNGLIIVYGNGHLSSSGGQYNGLIWRPDGIPPNVLTLSGTYTVYDNSSGNGKLVTGSVGGGGGILKTGPASVSLGGSNTYSGGTIITQGSILLGNAGALLNSTVAILVDNGLLFLPGIGSFNVGALSGSRSLRLSDTGGGPVTISVGGNGASTTFSGAITGNGDLIKTGKGALLLSGTNTYTGGTSVYGGRLLLTNPMSIKDGSNLTVGAGGSFDVVVNDTSVDACQFSAMPMNREPAAVPEPGTLALVVLAGAAAAAVAAGRQRAAASSRACPRE